MELRLVFICDVGAYLLFQEKNADRFVGVFCWSGEQILETLKTMRVPEQQVAQMTTQLQQPESRDFPKTHIRQPVTIEGPIAACIMERFTTIQKIKQLGAEQAFVQFPSLPTGQIFGGFLDNAEKKSHSAMILYVDPGGTPNMVVIRNQLQGLTVLSYNWMEETQKALCETFFQHLPIMSDDDLDVPILVQGELVRIMIIGIMVQSMLVVPEPPKPD